MAVIRAVATVSNTPELELEPLTDIIDPDILDALYSDKTPGETTFYYHGYEITITSEHVRITDDRRDGTGL